jgi:hypothetical protein
MPTWQERVLRKSGDVVLAFRKMLHGNSNSQIAAVARERANASVVKPEKRPDRKYTA